MHVRAGELIGAFKLHHAQDKLQTAISAARPLLLLRSAARDAFSRPRDACLRHLGAGDLLDLACRTASVIDQDALAEPEIGDVLLASDLLTERLRG